MRNIKDFSIKQLVVAVLLAFVLACPLALCGCTFSLAGNESSNNVAANTAAVNSGGTNNLGNYAQNADPDAKTYTFRNKNLRDSHYSKHGKDMGFKSAAAYEAAASAVANNPNALHKYEKEDGDDVYYIQETNDFVIVSTDGYIRTYFRPDNGMAYFKRQ